MAVFKYTEKFEDLNSSVVQIVWYNENDEEAFVSINNYGYIYQNVKKDEFNRFKAASSKGNFYSTEFKRQGRVGAYAGSIGWTTFLPVARTRQSSGGTSKGLSFINAEESNDKNLGLTNVNNAAKVSGNNELYKYVVVHEFNGKDRTHELKASSVNEVLSYLKNVGEMLDQELKPKSVTVYFE